MPASFFVIRHVRPKMSCRKCSCVVQAPAPERVIDRGLPGPGLLAHVVTAKFCDHPPLYRQSQIFAREGVDLDRSILARWVGEAAALLEPVAEVLRRYVLDTEKLHGDDTPLPVLAPGTGKTKTGRFWTYVRDNRPAGDKPRLLYGLHTRRIARVNIRNGIWPSSRAFCKPTHSPVLISSMRAERFRKRHAWRTFDATSSI